VFYQEPNHKQIQKNNNIQIIKCFVENVQFVEVEVEEVSAMNFRAEIVSPC